MSIPERKAFLNSFDIVFSDCDGVVWNFYPHGPIKNVDKGIDFLRSAEKKVVFVTNNSVIHIDIHIQNFEKYGINVKPEDVIHPAKSIVEYLQRIKFNGLIYCLSGSNFQKHLTDAGFEVMNGVSFFILFLYIYLIKHYIIYILAS